MSNEARAAPRLLLTVKEFAQIEFSPGRLVRQPGEALGVRVGDQLCAVEVEADGSAEEVRGEGEGLFMGAGRVRGRRCAQDATLWAVVPTEHYMDRQEHCWRSEPIILRYYVDR